MLVPEFGSLNVKLGDPPSVTSSPDSTPVNEAVPVAEAVVLLS